MEKLVAVIGMLANSGKDTIFPTASLSFLFTALLSFLFLRERLSGMKIVGIGLAAAGILVIR